METGPQTQEQFFTQQEDSVDNKAGEEPRAQKHIYKIGVDEQVVYQRFKPGRERVAVKKKQIRQV
jgi:hypothetical protein